MSVIWNRLIECQDEILNIFDSRATEIQEPGLAHFNQPENGWINRVWANDSVRRAHIDVVDARESRGLWMMHVCCFPNLNNDAPIYGFDVIAGKNKITGVITQFQRGAEGTTIQDWYANANIQVWDGSIEQKFNDIDPWRNIWLDQGFRYEQIYNWDDNNYEDNDNANIFVITDESSSTDGNLVVESNLDIIV